MLLEEVVDGALEHEGVVNGDEVDALNTEPTGLSSTGDGLIHHVVGNEEERLELGGHKGPSTSGRADTSTLARGHRRREYIGNAQQWQNGWTRRGWGEGEIEGGRTHELDAPSEEGSLEVFIIVEFTALEDLDRVDDRDTAVEFPTWDVVIEVLCT